MRIVPVKKNTRIVIIIIVTLLLISLGYLYFNKIWIFKPVEKSIQADNSERKIDNSVNYSKPTDEQKTAQFEKSKDEKVEKTEQVSSKIIISNAGFNDNGDYEISAYSAEVKDSNAKCILSINGIKNTEVGVQIYPHMAMCKGFIVAKSDLKNDKNKYEIEFISQNYKDKISGEF